MIKTALAEGLTRDISNWEHNTQSRELSTQKFNCSDLWAKHIDDYNISVFSSCLYRMAHLSPPESPSSMIRVHFKFLAMEHQNSAVSPSPIRILPFTPKLSPRGKWRGRNVESVYYTSIYKYMICVYEFFNDKLYVYLMCIVPIL